MVHFIIENLSSKFHKEINLYNSFLTDKFYWVDTDLNKYMEDTLNKILGTECIHQNYTLTIFKIAIYFIYMTPKI
jgi:hypothetical protein